MFKDFAEAVHAKLSALSKDKNQLFFKALVPDLFEQYLEAFPAGSNPIFRERTEHDCNCCKQFIRNLGALVRVRDGAIETLWDHEGLPAPYDTVAAKLAETVRSAQQFAPYFTSERRYGTRSNFDNHDPAIQWHHFYGDVPKACLHSNPTSQISDLQATKQVLTRGLQQIQLDHIDEVIDLIEDNTLYRGKEFLNSVKDFRVLLESYQKASRPDLFVLENLQAGSARIRNTVIGTLLVDRAEGVELEDAVKKYEVKMAPANYKRPKALITPRMIDQAVTKLRDLGLEDAIERRLATIEDLSVNDVLFVDNSVASKMKDGLTDLIMSSPSVKKSKKASKDPTKISIKDFMALGSKKIELVLDNSHLGNFVTLTAPVHSDSNKLFKWDNGFGWSYDGGVTDSMRELVVSRGGRVDGVFRFTHQWNYAKRNASLMDLHVFMPGPSMHRDGCHDTYPSCRRVGWNNRNDTKSGGIQDVDYTDAAPESYVPIENITFPDLDKMPEGKYVCKIHNWRLRPPTEGGFKAEIEFGGQIFEYEVDRPLRNKEWVTVAEVTLNGGKFSIDHKLPTTSASREKWGVATQVPVKVQTIMLSPNHWEGAGGVGNKHWFFVLEGCRVDSPVRGLYNEFLVDTLQPHRKVFEVLGSKTKCEPTEKQLSGVGFSETRSDKVVAIADGRPYEIHFS